MTIITNKQTNETNMECSICYDEIHADHGIKPPCGHEFHNKCLTQWILKHSSCPICRYKLADEDTLEEEEEASYYENDEEDGEPSVHILESEEMPLNDTIFSSIFDFATECANTNDDIWRPLMDEDDMAYVISAWIQKKTDNTLHRIYLNIRKYDENIIVDYNIEILRNHTEIREEYLRTYLKNVGNSMDRINAVAVAIGCPILPG